MMNRGLTGDPALAAEGGPADRPETTGVTRGMPWIRGCCARQYRRHPRFAAIRGRDESRPYGALRIRTAVRRALLRRNDKPLVGTAANSAEGVLDLGSTELGAAVSGELDRERGPLVYVVVGE